MRISIPLAGLNLSGGVKSLCLLANRLAERGERVRILAPDYAAQPPIPLDVRVQLCVIRTLGRGRSLSRQAQYWARLTLEAARGADLVLANYYLTTYPTWLSWLLHGRRAALAYNVRGYEPASHGLLAPAGWASRYLRFALAWLSYRLPFRHLVTTDWLKRMIRDPAALVVGHGIDLDVFQPVARADARATAPVVGVIGRLGDVKGYPDFLRAAERLAAEQTELRFLVVRADPVPLPSGRSAESLEARTEAEMAEFYRRCDLFVFPSLAEGFGLPALEAMACGCAVVTTDCGGVSAFARGDENCLMIPPGRPELLAAAIELLTREPARRAELASAGLATAARFGRRAALDRLAEALVGLARAR